jgi:hypothetical protein
MKITAFWDVAPCSLVQIDRRFRRYIGSSSYDAFSVTVLYSVDDRVTSE